jgi:hypothetical protein
MDTTRWLLQKTHRWPRHLRQTLTQRVEAICLEALELITAAAYTRQRRALLADLDDRLNRLRVLLRLAHELAVLPHGHYLDAIARLAEAGRMLGAWRKRPDLAPPITEDDDATP